MTATTYPSYAHCGLCPRECGINRNGGTKGFCLETGALKTAWAGLHFGEEPPVTGTGGSGTIFITGCNLHCAFCQNYQISQKGMGRTVSGDEFISMCLALQKKGAENINIVTGSHAIPVLADYLTQAKKDGLTIPVCWNSSSYETTEALSLLENVVDIWLPDLKTLNPLISKAVFEAEDYPKTAKKAVRWMIEHTPLELQQTAGTAGMKKGVIVRHLALPGRIDDTQLVLDWFKKAADGKAYLSLMSQYTPVPFGDEDRARREAALASFQNRYLSGAEFDRLQDMIESYGIQNGFYQELVQDTEWLPDFNRIQPFSSALAKPVWHWSCGFVPE